MSMREQETFEQFRQSFITEKQKVFQERFKDMDVSEGVPLDQVDAEFLRDLHQFLSAVHQDGDFSNAFKAKIGVERRLRANKLSFDDKGRLQGMKKHDATYVEFSGNDKYGFTVGVDDYDEMEIGSENVDAHETDLYVLLFNRYAGQDPEWLKRVGGQILAAGLPLKPTIKAQFDRVVSELK